MEDNTPIYETLFDIQVNLCERFPAMTPLSLRRERAREVFLLIGRYNKHNKKQEKKKNQKQVIRRKAGDDWF